MINFGKLNILGVMVDAVDYEAAIERIIADAQSNRPCAVSALAVHGVMTGVLDSSHRHRLNRLDLACPDGQPVRWALNLLHGAGLKDRVYGPDLMLAVCQRASQEGLPVYLYGSREETLQSLSQRLQQHCPGLVIAGAEPSRFRTITADEKRQLIDRINSSGAAITMVGLGCPRQEVWAYEYRNELTMPLLAVGAAFDFHAGVLPQAPPLLQRMGLEWLFRLYCEPFRLWRRYFLLNPLYMVLIAMQALKLRRFDPSCTVAPEKDLLYG